MKRCKTCVETDTRPTTKFDENGICLPCRSVSAQSVVSIDWDKRAKQLEEIVKWGKEHSYLGYDCLIGVSGGKDSTRQAIFAREHGLNPLLVCFAYPPEHVTQIGMENLANLVELGFDTITVAPAPVTYKDLMRNCFIDHGNLFSASELIMYATLPIVAKSYKIPLILLGENPGLAFGTDVGTDDYNGNKMKHMNTLRGGDPRIFKTPQMSDKDLYWYRYPDDTEMQKAQMRIVFLGYFMDDFNDHTNFAFATKLGLKTRQGEDAKPENIGGIASYVQIDSDHVFVNQLLRYYKFGFGKATQELGVAVRAGLMNREEAKRQVKAYDGKCHFKYIKGIADYLEMSVEEFWEVVDKFVNRELFEKIDGKWVMKEEADEW